LKVKLIRLIVLSCVLASIAFAAGAPKIGGICIGGGC